MTFIWLSTWLGRIFGFRCMWASVLDGPALFGRPRAYDWCMQNLLPCSIGRAKLKKL